MNPGYLTPAQVADHLGVSRSRVRDLIAADRITAIRVGRVWRLKPEWVEQYRQHIAEVAAERAATCALPSPVVYFIQSVVIGYIKIGTAADAMHRLGELQVGSADELQLVGAVAETGGIERGLHRRFDGSWVRGEWFHASAPVVDFVRDHSIYRGAGYLRLTGPR